ncbi:MAG: tRNA (adenosine(37)-N6)-dimethylallyltransferase MiaA [Prevotellaceae bacterium]|jgi:tRNA dimethylallyltransferase|nr:tRNA (adenosine(37)-N6)-dimethylallyltransferase MiaA [Prevotellaceae bacterium]
MKYDLLTILGPTAVGKTAVAVRAALHLDGEVLSGDSRQVYRGMDVGTGKDMAEYTVDGTTVPAHLIDLADAGEKYNLYRYQRDFLSAYESIRQRRKTPILCGGSGLYIEAVTRGYALPDAPPDAALRQALEPKSEAELTALLRSLKTLHNTSDYGSRQRTIRAIEIAQYTKEHSANASALPAIRTLFIGLTLPREQRRDRITQRLHDRLQNGLIEEVERLLRQGVPPDDLIYYGLEYKWVTRYLLRQITHREMRERLTIAIHQFAKRQMTWFRGMERRGVPIRWIDAARPMEEKVTAIVALMSDEKE